MLEYIVDFMLNHPYVLAIVALILGFMTDVVWCEWAKQINNRNRFLAANWSALIYIFGVTYTLIIIEKQIVPILAYLIGCYFGTFFAVTKMIKQDKENGE